MPEHMPFNDVALIEGLLTLMIVLVGAFGICLIKMATWLVTRK